MPKYVSIDGVWKEVDDDFDLINYHIPGTSPEVIITVKSTSDPLNVIKTPIKAKKSGAKK